MSKAASETILRFADISIDAAQGLLRDSGGLEIPIAPKPFDLLLVFARSPGRTISKAALLDAVWPGVHVTEDSLFQAVREIRRAIGDEDGRILRSLPKRGYLLDVEVRAASGMTADPTPALPALTPPADRPSLVVLPFVNMSADPDQDYFVDGLVEDIATALSCMRSFFVISRNSAFAYKGRAVDVRQIARELGVVYVLEGSVRRAREGLRVTGQLIDASSGAQIWAGRFDGALDDVFGLQDRVTEAVAGAMEPQLQRAEIEHAQRKSTRDLRAYDLFLRGMAIEDMSASALRQAQAYFTEVFTLSPAYAAAYGMASVCITNLKTQAVLSPTAPEIADGLLWARRAADYGRDDATAL